MDQIIHNGHTYSSYEYDNEQEFEKDIVKYSDKIFGNNTIYFDTTLQFES